MTSNTNIFQNKLPIPLFRSTNKTWNELKLNAPWSVGYIAMLVEAQNFDTKEAWEAFYYQTGNLRNEAIQSLPNQIRLQLYDIYLKSSSIRQLHWNIKNLNYNYGRTKKELEAKGKLLFTAMQKKQSAITLEQCVECVRFRVICETWNGIVIRERNTITVLQNYFPQVVFLKTNAAFDHKYAVDYQLYCQEKLICAIQIKPPSYAKNTSYILKAKYANQQKNELYKQQFGACVFNILAQNNGEPTDKAIIANIANLLQ